MWEVTVQLAWKCVAALTDVMMDAWYNAGCKYSHNNECGPKVLLHYTTVNWQYANTPLCEGRHKAYVCKCMYVCTLVKQRFLVIMKLRRACTCLWICCFVVVVFVRLIVSHFSRSPPTHTCLMAFLFFIFYFYNSLTKLNNMSALYLRTWSPTSLWKTLPLILVDLFYSFEF